MKKPLLILILLFSSFSSHSQEMSTMGKEFWFLFMDNAERAFTGDRHRAIITSKNACTVTITMPTTGWQTSVSVTPGIATVVPFSVSQSDNQTSGLVLNKGYRLVASDTVSVYVSTLGISNYDVTNVFPLSSLRDEYMIQSYPSDYWGSLFAVISTEDSTWIDIHVTSTTSTGVPAGDSISVLLPNAGQVYQLKSTAVGDFSGTTIKSRDCKPIGVFHGDVCAYIPVHESGATCDHAVEQAVPTSYWGKHFVVMRSSSTRNDRIRITSLEDSCIVYRNGTISATIDRGQTFEYQMSVGNNAEYVETTKPVTVNNYFASMGTSGLGDPSMVTINPIEQMVKDVTFGCFNMSATTNHKVNVVVKTIDRGLLSLDGSSIPIASFTVLSSNPEYSYLTLTVSAGSHNLKMNGGAGFVAYAYGMGSHESYAYSIGSSMRTLDNLLFVDGVQVFLGSQVSLCEGSPVHLNVEYDRVPNYVVWNIGDGNYEVGDSVVVSFNESGTFPVQALFFYPSAGCYNNNDTISVSIKVNPNDTTDLDSTVCKNPFIWFGDTIISGGFYSHLLENHYGCDSLVRLDIDFRTIPINEFVLEGCDSVDYAGITYTSNISFADTLETIGGCDSITNVSLTVYQSYDIFVQSDIYEGDTLYWVDGGCYWSEDQHPVIILRTQYGCDSVVRLRLNVIPREIPPAPDSMAIWIPNVFTPDMETNTIFKIEGYDIIEMHVYIYNRQGLFVAEFDGLNGGWDGTSKGQKCKQDAYVYLVEYRSKAMPAMTRRRIGTFTLLR